MEQVLQAINAAVWGLPLLLLIVGVGITLTVKTRFAQLTLFSQAMRHFLKKGGKRKELFTALAATVGTGNLAGVAGAISIGGPGAVFWMWVCGVIGMIIKFSEAVLAVFYRVKTDKGTYIGGPMYIITQALPKKMHWMAAVYCFFGVVAAFGVGNATQINTVVGSIQYTLDAFNVQMGYEFPLVLGFLLAVLIFFGLWSSEGNIGRVAEKLVPFAAVAYIVISLGVLITNTQRIIPAFKMILEGAVSPKAITGGMVGSAFLALRTGASRGVFTNEAGMGTAGIAHSEADVSHPVQQGLMGIVEVFIDTLLICTITALVILCSGINIPYGRDLGIHLTSMAFSETYGSFGVIIVSIMVCCFAIATVFGWSLYGGRCLQFLFGNRTWRVFVILQTLMVIVSASLNTETAWVFAEIINGLMAIPNLIVLIYLSPKVVGLYNEYRLQQIKSRRLRQQPAADIYSAK